MASRQNIWPFGDSTKTTTVYHRRGASFSRGANYKGYRVWEDENGWHTSLDPGSWFDTKKDVTRFVDSWEKSRDNPAMCDNISLLGFHPNPRRGWYERCVKNVLPLATLATEAPGASGLLGSSEKWLKKHGVMPKGNPTIGSIQKHLRLKAGGIAVLNQNVWSDRVTSELQHVESITGERMSSGVFDEMYDYGMDQVEKQARARGRINPKNVTDRALRYRAVKSLTAPKICNLCGSKQGLMVGHVNGHEEDTEPENLFWTCRSCNTLASNAMQRAGVGRLTHQYNPQGGAKTWQQWITAVTSMKGENSAMSVPDAVAMIRATSPAKRSEYAAEIWKLRKGRGNPMNLRNPNRDMWFEKTKADAERYAANLRESGYTKVRIYKASQRVIDKIDPNIRWVVAWGPWKKNGKRGNPEAESATAFEAFHGYHPEEQIVVDKDQHYHSQLWAVGKLEKLSVLSPDGVLVDLSGFQGAMLSANEANTQLYIEGGDQAVELSEFDLGEPYHDKEDLGEVVKIWYFTNKTHLGDQGGEAVYHHKFGEEKTKRASYIFGKMEGRKVPRPRLAYDVVNQALEFIGGEYLIEPEGIRN